MFCFSAFVLLYIHFSSDIMNNKVFYQHPNLMRILGMHETVMQVMVNVLGGDKSQVCKHLLLHLSLLLHLLLLHVILYVGSIVACCD